MNVKNKLKYIVILGVIVLSGFALADALGVFNPKPYTAVTHGSHVHYVPNDRDPNVPIDDFPMKEPAPGQMITPQGKIVKKPQQ